MVKSRNRKGKNKYKLECKNGAKGEIDGACIWKTRKQQDFETISRKQVLMG